MGEVPIEFVLFSAWSQHIVPVKLLEVGFYKVVDEVPIFLPLFFFILKRPFFLKKIMGGATMNVSTNNP